jgi:hypothetical protein
MAGTAAGSAGYSGIRHEMKIATIDNRLPNHPKIAGNYIRDPGDVVG